MRDLESLYVMEYLIRRDHRFSLFSKNRTQTSSSILLLFSSSFFSFLLLSPSAVFPTSFIYNGQVVLSVTTLFVNVYWERFHMETGIEEHAF